MVLYNLTRFHPALKTAGNWENFAVQMVVTCVSCLSVSFNNWDMMDTSWRRSCLWIYCDSFRMSS